MYKRCCSVVVRKNKKDLTINQLGLYEVGVAGFEPAISWSQTRRLDRTGPHPEKSVLQRKAFLCNHKGLSLLIAERQGFEPWVPLWGTLI